MSETCGDDRFELIEKAKAKLLDSTNIESRPEEVAVLDSILFRCWQMGWLDQLRDGAAELGSGACKVESEFWHDHGGDDSDTYEFVLSCGHSVEWLDSEQPRYCPDCGRKVSE